MSDGLRLGGVDEDGEEDEKDAETVEKIEEEEKGMSADI